MKLMLNLILNLLSFLALVALAKAHLHGNIPSKHIVFSTTFGGASHVKPMISYAKELKARGHTITLATLEDFQIFAERFGFNKLSLGPKINDTVESEMIKTMVSLPYEDADVLTLLITIFKQYYIGTYERMEILFRGESPGGKVDFVVCDFFVFHCMDLARKYGINYAISVSNLGAFGMGDEPYTTSLFSPYPPTSDKNTYWQRVETSIIFPMKLAWRHRSTLANFAAVRQSYGHSDASVDFSNLYTNKLVLVNSFAGFEVPRFLAPTIQYVGPTLTSLGNTEEGLDAELKHELDQLVTNKRKAIFVAFGFQARIPREMINSLIQGFTKALNESIVDRIYWAMARNDHLFPPQGKVDPRIRLMKFAPQKAMLAHSAIKVFISHCGGESSQESAYAGKPVVAIPLFVDQAGNAAKYVETGAGVMLSKLDLTEENIASKLKIVVEDVDGSFAKNVKRLQNLARIGYLNGPHLAVDLIEFASEFGYEHLIPACTKMNPLKAKNLDIYLPFLAVLLGCLYVHFRIVKWLIRIVRWKVNKIKNVSNGSLCKKRL